MTTILIVDDSPSMRQMLAFTLKQAGFNVVDAIDGEDALLKLQHTTPALIITDQNMPRMDGIHFVKTLRQQDQYLKIPILILTTESGDQMKSSGRAAGATGWLVKPFDPVRLIEVVQKVLSR